MNFTHKHERSHNQRRGTATFELLMAMPLLFSIIILITWQGFSMIGRAEVTVQARHDAWQKRYDDPPGDPLVFLQGDILEEADLVESDIIDGEASTSFELSPLVDGLPDPEAKLRLMVGSWDHRQLPLDEPPNYKVHGLMAGSALLGRFQNLLVQAGNIWQRVENAAEGLADWQEGLFESLDGDLKEIDGSLDEDRERKREELKQQMQDADDRIESLDQQLDETNDRIKDLVLEGSEEAGEGEEQETESAELQLLLAKRNRLKTDLEDARKDRVELEREYNEL